MILTEIMYAASVRCLARVQVPSRAGRRDGGSTAAELSEVVGPEGDGVVIAARRRRRQTAKTRRRPETSSRSQTETGGRKLGLSESDVTSCV